MSKTEKHTFEASCKKMENGKGYIIYPKHGEWGPVISASSKDEAKKKFDKAFKRCLLLKTFYSINESLEKGKFDQELIEKTVKKNSDSVNELFEEEC